MKASNASKSRKAIQLVVATGVTLGAVQAMAAVDGFLAIPGLPGESAQVGHKDDIDVISFAQTLDSKKCRYTIVKNLDKSSPGLAEATAKKSAFPAVTYAARKAGEGQKDFYVVTLYGATVESLDQVLSATSLNPAEQVVLAPKSVSISYKPQDDKGGLGAAVTTTLNCDK